MDFPLNPFPGDPGSAAGLSFGRNDPARKYGLPGISSFNNLFPYQKARNHQSV